MLIYLKRNWVPLLGYILIIVLVFGGALWPPGGQLIFGDDIHRQYYFYREFINHSLKQGIIPWWNPYNFAGNPFVANPVVSLWYPPNWLFILLPLNLAYSWHLVLHLLLAMLGMYFLLQRILPRAFPQENPQGVPFFGVPLRALPARLKLILSWVAGVVFGLSGFFAARLYAGHVDMIAAAAWLPWVFGAFWRLGDGVIGQRRERWNIAIAAGLLATQIYAGYQTMAFFTLEAVFIVSLLNCFIVKNIKPLARSLIAVSLGLGLAGLQIIPEQEFFRLSIRTFSLPYSWINYGSLKWESLWQLVNPWYFGSQFNYSGPPPNYAEQAMFVGRAGITFLLIWFGVLNTWVISRLGSTFFRDARLVSPRSVKPSHQSGNFMRNVFCGWSSVLFKKQTQTAFKPRAALAFFLIAFFALWVSMGSNAPVDLQKILWQLVPMYHYLRIPPRHLVLFVFGTSGLLGLGFALLRLPRLLKTLLVIATIAEMVLFARQFVVLAEIPEARHDKELIAILKQDKEPYRVLPNFGVWVPPRDSFDFDSSMSYGIFSATGYDPSILRSYYEFIEKANNQPPGSSILNHDVQVPYLDLNSPYLDFLNIKYILLPTGHDPLGGQSTSRFALIREDKIRDYRLYENKTVWPRFFWAKENSCERKVEVLEYGLNRIVLKVNNQCDGYLLSSEVMYPGWEAYIDDKKTDIIVSNHVFRTLFVGGGQHKIEYRFVPRIFVIGGLVSFGTLLLIGIWLIKTKITPHLRWIRRRFLGVRHIRS